MSTNKLKLYCNVSLAVSDNLQGRVVVQVEVVAEALEEDWAGILLFPLQKKFHTHLLMYHLIVAPVSPL